MKSMMPLSRYCKKNIVRTQDLILTNSNSSNIFFPLDIELNTLVEGQTCVSSRAVEADLAQSLSALGAAKPCAEAGPIVEDGRLQVAASSPEIRIMTTNHCHPPIPRYYCSVIVLSSSSSSSYPSIQTPLGRSFASKVWHLHVGRCFRCWDAKRE